MGGVGRRSNPTLVGKLISPVGRFGGRDAPQLLIFRRAAAQFPNKVSKWFFSCFFLLLQGLCATPIARGAAALGDEGTCNSLIGRFTFLRNRLCVGYNFAGVFWDFGLSRIPVGIVGTSGDEVLLWCTWAAQPLLDLSGDCSLPVVFMAGWLFVVAGSSGDLRKEWWFMDAAAPATSVRAWRATTSRRSSC